HEPANNMRLEVRHVQVAGGIDCDIAGTVEPRVAVGAIDDPGRACQSCECGHHASRSDLADGVVELVGHIYVGRAVHSDTFRMIESRAAAGAVVGAGDAGEPGQGAHHTPRRDFADRVVT